MWKKVIGYTLLGIVAISALGFAYLYFRQPARRPAPDIKVAMTAERIARGKYIFMLADCDGCHSQHDETKLYIPVIESGRGRGNVIEEKNLPGRIVAANITPDPETGLGRWTDGEKVRAIREGISRDDSMLFPMMPYDLYRHISDDDVQALVAYLNSLPPIRNALPRSQVKFPVNVFIKGAPQPVDKPVARPDRSNTLAYGEYLATVGVCEGCHTPMGSGGPDRSKRLAGGNVFHIRDYQVVSSNITRDPDTGIGNWSLGYFRERFYRHKQWDTNPQPSMNAEQFTGMPWLNLAKLPQEDLDAIYVYLRAQRPVSNKVIVHPVLAAATR